MKPIEHNILGFEYSARGRETFQAIDPATGAPLEGNFVSATEEEVDEALKKARRAFASYRNAEPALRARFLRAIAEELEGIADALVGRVMSETALPEGRVRGELGRTTFQLRLFAQLVEEGSYVEAVIDHGDPQRAPLPKPDVRRRMVALGPVVVFTASNFPLAFSTAGGDTAS
ncbi:MAG: aldehyde dehydrogenase family protein, partial [Bacteroidetes bacterium]